MPWFWTIVPNSDDPKKRRAEVRRIVSEAGGKLANNELFFAMDDNLAAALYYVEKIETGKAVALALRASTVEVLLSTDEMVRAVAIRDGLGGRT